MKISALLREAPVHPKLSLDKDLIQKAMLKFPGYSSQQALTLYMADTAAQQQQTDAAQNNLINKQQSALKTIGQELNDYEAQAQETDREVERLKQLSGALTTGSADTKQRAKVSADDLEKLHKELETLKSKPGMNSEKFKELEAQINAMASNPSADDKDIQKMQGLLASVQNKQSIGDEQYNKLVKELEHTNGELERKEARFKKYIQTTGEKTRTVAQASAEEMKKYADIIDNYKQKLDNFDKEIVATTTKTQQDAEEARKVLNIIKSLYNNAKDSVDPTAPTLDTNQQAANDQGDEEPTNQQGQPIAPISNDLLNLYKGGNINMRAESVNIVEYEKSPPRIYKDWGQPEFNKWMKDHLVILINLFKGKFKDELARKNPTYGDGQISYDIQEEAWFLKKIFDGDDPILTKPKMDAYLDLVKMTLFSQPVEISHQDDLPLRESLHKTYERMLDKIIGLPYI